MDIKRFAINDTEFVIVTFWPRNAKYGTCYFDWLRISYGYREGRKVFAHQTPVSELTEGERVTGRLLPSHDEVMVETESVAVTGECDVAEVE